MQGAREESGSGGCAWKGVNSTWMFTLLIVQLDISYSRIVVEFQFYAQKVIVTGGRVSDGGSGRVTGRERGGGRGVGGGIGGVKN